MALSGLDELAADEAARLRREFDHDMQGLSRAMRRLALKGIQMSRFGRELRPSNT
jgi:hypothetical protein